MTTQQDEELLFVPLHTIFVFCLVGFLALALFFAFIAFFVFGP